MLGELLRVGMCCSWGEGAVRGANPVPQFLVDLTRKDPCLSWGGRNYTGTCLGGL